ncbi:MAG: hypothetical protein WAM82_29440 [Thermoanaerobaculia bacterium]
MTEGFAGNLLGAIVAQAQIRILVAVLKMVRDMMRAVLAALPLTAQERDPLVDLDADPGITSELRRVLESVLADCLEPAIQALSAVAELRTGKPVSSGQD